VRATDLKERKERFMSLNGHTAATAVAAAAAAAGVFRSSSSSRN